MEVREKYRDAPLSNQVGVRCCGCGRVGPRARFTAKQEGWHQITVDGELVTSSLADEDIVCPDCRAYHTLRQMQGI